MKHLFRNLVFESGGVKGIAYLGALEVLTDKDIIRCIQRVGGTSAGAVHALVLGLGFNLEETRDIFSTFNYNCFLDDSGGIFRDTDRLLERFGWFRGNFFRNWAAELIKEKTGNPEATFADLEAMKSRRGFKSLYFIGTNLSSACSEIFSAEHTPRTCVADAVRIAMTIPLFFAARRSTRGDIYVDGGLLNNRPVRMFDREEYVDRGPGPQTDCYREINALLKKSKPKAPTCVYNPETLGFRLAPRETMPLFHDQSAPPRRRINDFFDYSWALIQTILEMQHDAHLPDEDWARTVFIDSLGVGTAGADLSEREKRALIQSGRKGMLAYLEWYNNRINETATARRPYPDTIGEKIAGFAGRN